MSTKHGSLSEQARHRLAAGELILRGFDNDEIVDILEVSISSVKRWRKQVKNDGLHALARKSQPGRPKKLDDAKRQELNTIIHAGAKASGYMVDRWTSRIVADHADGTCHAGDWSFRSVALIRSRWSLAFRTKIGRCENERSNAERIVRGRSRMPRRQVAENCSWRI